jgi:hypothetical protein
MTYMRSFAKDRVCCLEGDEGTDNAQESVELHHKDGKQQTVTEATREDRTNEQDG